MTANLSEYFSKYQEENSIVFKNAKRSYTVKDIKQILKASSSDCDNSAKPFIDILKELDNTKEISFLTSGSTAESKCVKTALDNMFVESGDMQEEFELTEGLELFTTTTVNHRFGMTCFLLLGMYAGCIINTDRINYPEDIKTPNSGLVTTPSFLSIMEKYNIIPEFKLEIIITAGSKLQDSTFEYAQKISKRVIEIYGSSETGTIGYRETYKTPKLKLLKGINIITSAKEYTKIKTAYSLNNIQLIGDRVKEIDGCIELLGRCDRVLKIQEKRVSAEDIENEIKTYGIISDCYCFEYSKKIAVIAVLNELGQELLIKDGKLNLVKKAKSYLNDKFEVIPQKWKFIDEIPKTANGKIDKKRIEEIFDINLSFPLILSRNITNDSARFELCFLKDSNFFRGHFPEVPVLAGVVQLFYANFFAKQAFGIDCRRGQIRKIKFTNIIRPDKNIILTLQKSETSINYKYEDMQRTYSSGTLPLKNTL